MKKWEQLKEALAELTRVVEFLAGNSDNIEICKWFDPFCEAFTYSVKYINNRKLCEIDFPFSDYDKKEIQILKNDKEKTVFKCFNSNLCVYCVLDKAKEVIVKYNFEEMEEIKKLIKA